MQCNGTDIPLDVISEWDGTEQLSNVCACVCAGDQYNSSRSEQSERNEKRAKKTMRKKLEREEARARKKNRKAFCERNLVHCRSVPFGFLYLFQLRCHCAALLLCKMRSTGRERNKSIDTMNNVLGQRTMNREKKERSKRHSDGNNVARSPKQRRRRQRKSSNETETNTKRTRTEEEWINFF